GKRFPRSGSQSRSMNARIDRRSRVRPSVDRGGYTPPVFEHTMRNLAAAPSEAFSEMLNAIADYTNDRLPWEPAGADTTYISVIRIDELTTLYAVPDDVVTDSQRAILARADRTYLPLYLLDKTVPPGVLGESAVLTGGDHGAAALRVVSWLEGTGD